MRWHPLAATATVPRTWPRGAGPDHPLGAGAAESHETRSRSRRPRRTCPARWLTAAEIAGAQRHPRGGARREVRPARQAHRRRGRARQRPVGARGRGAARRDRARPGSTSTSSCTSARCGRTARSGRRRPGSRTGSAPTRAYAVEYDNVSCGTPVALRLARDMLARRGGPANRPRRRGLPRVVPARLRKRALAVHVQLRRRRGRRAAGRRRRPERAARLSRDHRRLLLAPGQGAVGRQRLLRTATTASSTSPTRPR